MKISFDPKIVLISFGIAFLGSYISICYCDQYRLFRSGLLHSKTFAPSVYLFLMAVSLGAIGVWCMHFVGQSALKLHSPEGSHLSVYYNIPVTVASFLSVLIFSWAGLFISSYDIAFTKTKSQLAEAFVENASQMSIHEIRKLSATKILYLISVNSLQHLIGGGFLTGAGVVVMHYVGMSAIRFQGHIQWNIGIIVSSVVIAFVASTAAFWILFRLLSIFPHKEVLRITSALLMAVAVCGVHYSGMAAATFDFDPDMDPPSAGPGSLNMTTYEAFSACLILASLLSFVLIIILFGEIRYGEHSLIISYLRADDAMMRIKDLPHVEGPVRRVVDEYLRKKAIALKKRIAMGQGELPDVAHSYLDFAETDEWSVSSQGSSGTHSRPRNSNHSNHSRGSKDSTALTKIHPVFGEGQCQTSTSSTTVGIKLMSTGTSSTSKISVTNLSEKLQGQSDDVAISAQAGETQSDAQAGETQNQAQMELYASESYDEEAGRPVVG